MGMMEDGNGGWSGMRMGVGLLGHVRLWLGCLMRCSPCDARERSSVFGFNGSSVQVEPGLDKKLVKLTRWLGTKVLRLDSFIF
jgi:hypothetical protein